MNFLCRNFFSQLEDERNETETRLEKMSRDMEGVYQTKVTEKLQKLDESKQNVNEKIGLREGSSLFFFVRNLGFENSRNISIEYSTGRRTSAIKTRRIRTFKTRMGRKFNQNWWFCGSNWFTYVRFYKNRR